MGERKAYTEVYGTPRCPYCRQIMGVNGSNLLECWNNECHHETQYYLPKLELTAVDDRQRR